MPPDEQKVSPPVIHGEESAPGGAGKSEPGQAAFSSRAYRPRHEPLWNNPITIVGLFLTLVAILIFGSTAVFSVVRPVNNPYVDIITYLIVPCVLILGTALMPFGIFAKSWWLRRLDRSRKLAFRYPRIDLADPVQRRTAKILLVGSFIMLPVVGVTSYHGYHYTDSTSFCAEACHSVMEPQGTTHAESAHARVACAECHIGTGASWFVKSKLSGTRQVLAVWERSYSRPIPPAIRHLRPARDTCEHCHWPKKFFGSQLRRLARFESDEDNTRHEIDLLLQTGGGGDATTGMAEGIHWHTSLKDEIQYIATDDLLQEIPWLVWTDPAGNKLIYRSDGRPSSDPKPEGQVRELDCMDCHNRPAHRFRSPSELIDESLETHRIDRELPYIKRESLRLLSRPYKSRSEAKEAIRTRLGAFYRKNYADLYEKKRAAIETAAVVLGDLFAGSFFPEMKVDWRTYPDNIGHKESAGCYRCHDGNHINQNGDPISHACETCHTFLNPVGAGEKGTGFQRGAFVHPFELGELHGEVQCQKCHTGGPIDRACAGCHVRQRGLYTGSMPELAAWELKPNPMADAVDCEACHDTSEPMTLKGIDTLCMDCHDDEEYQGMLARWVKDLGDQRASAEAAVQRVFDYLERTDPDRADGDAWSRAEHWRSALNLLRSANPVHSPQSAGGIYVQIAKEAEKATGSGPS